MSASLLGGRGGRVSDRCGGSGGCERVLGPAPNSASGLLTAGPGSPRQRHGLRALGHRLLVSFLGRGCAWAPISLQTSVLSRGRHCGCVRHTLLARLLEGSGVPNAHR